MRECAEITGLVAKSKECYMLHTCIYLIEVGHDGNWHKIVSIHL